MNDVRMAIAAWPGRRRDELMWSGLAVAIGTSLAAAHALSAYRISAYALPAALLAIGFLLLILRQPVVGVAAMFLVIPLDAARLPIGIGHVAPSEAILLLVALSWLCRAAVDVDNVPLPRARDVPLVAIVVVTTLGITVAADTVYVTRVSLLWAALLVLYLQVQAFSLAQMRLVIGALTIGGSITAVIGAVAFLGSSDSSVLEGGLVTQDRAIAAGHDANHFGAIVAMSTLPAIALVVGNLRRHAWLLPAALFGPVAIAFSLSRGAMLALAAGLIVVLRSSRMRVAALGVTTAVVLLTLSGVVAFPGGDKLSTVQTRIATLGGSASEIGGTRPQLWEPAMSLGASQPFHRSRAQRVRALHGRAGPVRGVRPARERAQRLPRLHRGDRPRRRRGVHRVRRHARPARPERPALAGAIAALPRTRDERFAGRLRRPGLDARPAPPDGDRSDLLRARGDADRPGRSSHPGRTSGAGPIEHFPRTDGPRRVTAR